MDDLTLDVVIAAASAANSGVEFVYRLLTQYAERTSIPDAVLVTDDARLGRQVFRSGSGSLLSSDLSRMVAASAPGIYVEGGRMAEDGSTVLVQLANMALRFDVLSQDATRDGLTGLFNRRAFDDFLAQAVGRTKRAGWPFAVVLLDVNGFKLINDRLGHLAGDAALRTIGTEMRRVLRVGDMAARVGGDEFALILHDGGQAAVAAVLKRLHEAVARSTEGLEIGLSAGVAFAPSDGTEVARLYRIADQRMYEEKRR